jgi:hypothetical protein
MRGAKLHTQTKASLEAENREYVGFWLKVWAAMIDTVVLLIITTPLLMMVYGRNYFSLTGTLQGPADFLISYLLPAVTVVVNKDVASSHAACFSASG